MNPGAYLKAILAGIAAALAALIASTQDGSGISVGEWLTAAGALVGGFNLVYWPPNANG